MTLKEKLSSVKALEQLIDIIIEYYARKGDVPTLESIESTIKTEIAKSGHASFDKADSVPSPEEAEDNKMYLVKNNQTGYYDIYAKVGEEVVRLDDTTVDLSNYMNTEQVKAELDKKVDKVDGKGLSTKDYTAAEHLKLAGVADNATKVEKSSTNGNVIINGQETKVYELAEKDISGMVASDDEINAMLKEKFGIED